MAQEEKPIKLFWELVAKTCCWVGAGAWNKRAAQYRRINSSSQSIKKVMNLISKPEKSQETKIPLCNLLLRDSCRKSHSCSQHPHRQTWTKWGNTFKSVVITNKEIIASLFFPSPGYREVLSFLHLLRNVSYQNNFSERESCSQRVAARRWQRLHIPGHLARTEGQCKTLLVPPKWG